ncbi:MULTISPECIES: hypothetical protein [Burkholderia]|uniref:Lipoprotein n=1 Tax=Burkholderia contaminans TaxID=488447 RepID=A0A2S5DRH8_9BURK|nr:MULTISPECIES: hypothetical protein [Burkholderia]POZ81559.1 hypothetical protein C3743_14595 [Burkholderia contaminans]POZ81709.1 hypothetical protein C3743_15440 [Burkholderia contaminans]
MNGQAVFVIGCGLLLAGCQTCPTVPPARIVDTACLWVKPMTASPADTPETKREILEYELARRVNCRTSAPTQK